MDYAVDGNIYAFIKHGTPPEKDLVETEQRLRLQYADAIGNSEYKMYYSLLAEITDKEITLVQIESLITALRSVYCDSFINSLNRLLSNANLVLDVSKPEQYDKTLDRALRRSRSIKMAIDLKKLTIEKLETKYNQWGSKATREHYYGLLIELSNDAGFHLTESISVFEMCDRLKRYNKKTETLKKKSNG